MNIDWIQGGGDRVGDGPGNPGLEAATRAARLPSSAAPLRP